MIDNFKVYRDEPPDMWDEFILKLNGNFFHSTHWATYKKETQNIRPLFFAAFDKYKDIIGGALALLRCSKRKYISRIFREIEFSSHPFLDKRYEKEIVHDFMKESEKVAKSFNCMQIKMNSNMSGMSIFKPSNFGYSVTERHEFIIDLTEDLDTLWKNIKKDQRERIRRQKKQGVTIEVAKNREDVLYLKKAREVTRTVRKLKGQNYYLSENDDFYFRIFDNLIKNNVAKLFYAKNNNDVIASILFSTYNKKAYSIFSGSTDIGYKFGAQSGLFWEAVECFKEQNFIELNRGGLPATAQHVESALHGIYRFKKRLGTTPILCTSGIKILSRLRYKMVEMRDRFIKPN